FLGFEGLDRKRDPAGAAVDRGDLGIDLLADGETVRTLLAAIAGQLGTTDDAGGVARQGQLKAAVMHRGDGAGDDLPLADAADCSLERIVRELLHAEADTLLLDVDVE